MYSPAQELTTITGISEEILNQISKNEDEVRDLDSLRNLFVPSATIAVLMNDGDEAELESISLDEFIELFDDPYYSEYHEWQTGLVVDEYNGIAQAFQSWAGKDSEGTTAKGLTSYQLVFVEQRWWIANILYTISNGDEIPKKYLGIQH